MTSGTPYWEPSACPNSEPRLSREQLTRGVHYNRTSPLSKEEEDIIHRPLSVVANLTTGILDSMPFLRVEEGQNSGQSLFQHYGAQMAMSLQVNSPSTRQRCY
jgi:hypothetical protein